MQLLFSKLSKQRSSSDRFVMAPLKIKIWVPMESQ